MYNIHAIFPQKKVNMKSKLILVFFFFAQQVLFSQASNQPAPELRRWSIGIGASSELSYRYLNAVDYELIFGQALEEVVIESRNRNEKASFGFTAGILSEYWINKRFSLEFGFFYAKRGYETEEFWLANNTGTGSGIGYYKRVYYIIDFPVRINYTSKLTERWFLSSGLGITSNFLLKRVIKSHFEWTNGNIEDKNQTVKSDYDMFNLSPSVSVSAGYKLGDRSAIKAGYIFRYAILAPTETTIIEHLYQLGFQCSYSISL